MPPVHSKIARELRIPTTPRFLIHRNSITRAHRQALLLALEAANEDTYIQTTDQEPIESEPLMSEELDEQIHNRIYYRPLARGISNILLLALDDDEMLYVLYLCDVHSEYGWRGLAKVLHRQYFRRPLMAIMAVLYVLLRQALILLSVIILFVFPFGAWLWAILMRKIRTYRN